MEVKAVPIRSNGRREGIIARGKTGRRRVMKRFSIRVAFIPKGLGVGKGCKQVRERH